MYLCLQSGEDWLRPKLFIMEQTLKLCPVGIRDISRTVFSARILFCGSTALFTVLAIGFAMLCGRVDGPILFPLAITFGTIAYHLLMRALVSIVVTLVMHNRANPYNVWFRERRFEAWLFRWLKIRRWKFRVPNFEQELFDLGKHTPSEIVGAMCQAEVVHEVIIPLSFVPIAFAHWFGALPVFVLTSVGAAACDTLLVLLQRYNRTRMMRYAKSVARRSRIHCP